MSESVAPVLADIVRLWLRGDPTLNEHFYVHKEELWFTVRLRCRGTRSIIASTYNKDEWPEDMSVTKDTWYFVGVKIKLDPADPKFFEKLEKQLKRSHNEVRGECLFSL